MTRITTTAHQNDSSADDDTTIEYQLGPGDFGRAQDVGESAIVNECGSGSNDESAAPEFGDRHTYFDQRKRKLAEQAQQRAENAPKYTPIFAGVVFHINGYTQPSHYELKKLLIERGGRFLHYLSKLQVTHIIASNLARSKEKELRNYRVVRPEWVVESVKADRLLSWHTYRLGDSASRGVPVALVGADELADLRKVEPPSTSCQQAWPNAEPLSVVLPTTRPPRPPQRIIIDKYGEGLNRDWVRRNLATEKDFIQRYYANSRLHHLSTWKAELKDYVARLRREHHKDTAAPAAGRQRIIMHADFDCFFVSASLLSYPQLKDRPVAVCHSQQQMQVDDEGRAARMSEYSANSSQIASCNYAARSFGVKNGMFIGQARQLCPTLATVPYCFDAYKRISTAFYDIITRISGETQAVSVDEALIDVSNVVEREFQGNATALAEEIRKRVLAQTQCTVSIGIGPSILLARLATAKAKPNSVYSLDVSGYYELELGVRDLPGVGHTVEDTLGRHGIKTVADIRAVPLRRLQEICGEKTAATLHSFSRGVDDQVLESDKLRQAFGADIGWGVRFSNQDEVEDFVQRLAAEVCTSMAAADRVGSLVTLKIKKRQEGQGKPGKFLGHGICDNLSKSISLSQMTSDPVRISAACISLWQRMHVDPLDVRAVGIQVQRLNSFDNSATISDMFAKSKAQVVTGNYKQTDAGFDLPSASQLDMSVLDELPASIQEELRAALHQTSDGAGAKVFKTPDVSPAQPALPSSKSTSAKSSKGTFGSRRGRPRKLAFPTSNVKPGKTKATLLDSFRKLETLDMVMPSQMDGDVWNQLPVNIRRELARDYVRSKPPTATLESDGPAVLAEEVDLVEPAPAVPEYSGPTLLGKHSFDEVKAVVKEWACSSAGGPLDEDVAKFAEYVDSLVKAHDLTMANGVFLYFKLCIQDRQGAWQTAASAVAAKVNQTCVEMYQAQLFV